MMDCGGEEHLGNDGHLSHGRELYDHVDSGQWSDAIRQSSTHPTSAKYVGPYRQTVLHLAILRDAPVDVISALLRAHPAAASSQDEGGCTPLHDACHRASAGLVRELLRADPRAVSVPERHRGGLTPLSYLCSVWADTLGAARRRLLVPTQVPIELLHKDWILARFWEKACLFVRAAHVLNSTRSSCDMEERCGGDEPERSAPPEKRRKFRIVHACAGLLDCPPDILRLAVRFHPEQLCERDEMGNLPLHVAAGTTATLSGSDHAPPALDGSGSGSDGEDEEDDDVDFSPIDFLLNAYPAAAEIPNNERRLPLHLAVGSGKPWVGGIEPVLRACPSAVHVRDGGGSSLYPFMVAAVGAGGKEKENKAFPPPSQSPSQEVSDYEGLSSIYSLLVSCPELERFVGT